jgi:hypothetical protein
MGCMTLQLFLATLRPLLLILCWKACSLSASSIESSGSSIEALGSGSLSLSTSIATAGVPLTFFVSSADANAAVCVQVLNSSLHHLHSFVSQYAFNGSFAVESASRHTVASYALRNGGLNFSASVVSFDSIHEAPVASTIKLVELSRDDFFRPFLRWTGMLKGPCTGEFHLNITSAHSYSLRINSTVLVDNLDLRVVGLSSTIVPLFLVENSFSDIEVSVHVKLFLCW